MIFSNISRTSKGWMATINRVDGEIARSRTFHTRDMAVQAAKLLELRYRNSSIHTFADTLCLVNCINLSQSNKKVD